MFSFFFFASAGCRRLQNNLFALMQTKQRRIIFIFGPLVLKVLRQKTHLKASARSWAFVVVFSKKIDSFRMEFAGLTSFYSYLFNF